MTREELLEKIQSLKTANGGWTKDSLESLGVEWPPPKGWIDALMEKAND